MLSHKICYGLSSVKKLIYLQLARYRTKIVMVYLIQLKKMLFNQLGYRTRIVMVYLDKIKNNFDYEDLVIVQELL